jgi:hypothetical protein
MKNPSPTLIGFFGILFFFLPASHAANGNKGNHSHRVSVTISPTASSLQAGQSQQFAATVSGTSNTAVNWLVNGSIGGNSGVGTISPSGVYSAPAAAPSSSVTVTAQSAYQSTASASAAVSITPAATVSVSVSISPGSATLQVNGSQQFAAAVSGTTYTSVNWLVSGVLGGNSSVGTISSSGLYTAPANAPTGPVTVTAQSTYQSTASASAAVSITPPATVSVSISPSNASLQVAGSQQFAAAVSGTTYTSVNWLVSGVLGGNSSVGTISSSGLYTAPASAPTGPVTVTAQSTYDPNGSASASVIVTAPIAHDVNLSWIASSSPVAGYNIYRGTQSSGPFARINSLLDTATVYTDGSVVSGRIYYYVTTAVDSSGAESGYSNLAQAVIP